MNWGIYCSYGRYISRKLAYSAIPPIPQDQSPARFNPLLNNNFYVFTQHKLHFYRNSLLLYLC